MYMQGRKVCGPHMSFFFNVLNNMWTMTAPTQVGEISIRLTLTWGVTGPDRENQISPGDELPKKVIKSQVVSTKHMCTRPTLNRFNINLYMYNVSPSIYMHIYVTYVNTYEFILKKRYWIWEGIGVYRRRWKGEKEGLKCCKYSTLL